MTNQSQEHEAFTAEERTNILEFGEVLRDIHTRLAREGYFLSDGKTWNIFKVVKPPPYNPKDYQDYKPGDYDFCEG
ncbi:MAG: hypothetical protein Q7S50_00130 [bacterium]|nr:hypothetical protein [bacterium]